MGNGHKGSAVDKKTTSDKKRSVLRYITGAVILLLLFLVPELRQRDEDRNRLAEIKKDKEVAAFLLEFGYPGDDPTESPGEEWESAELDGEAVWFNPNTEATLIPIQDEDGTMVYWYYKASNNKYYRIDKDGSFMPE